MPPNAALLVSAVASPIVAVLAYWSGAPQIVVSGLLWAAAAFSAAVGVYGLVSRGPPRTTALSVLLVVYAVPLAMFGMVGCAFGSCAPWIG